MKILFGKDYNKDFWYADFASNIYFLNPGLVWKDKTGKRLSSIQDYDANTFYFAEFEAKIVIGSDEQEDFKNNI